MNLQNLDWRLYKLKRSPLDIFMSRSALYSFIERGVGRYRQTKSSIRNYFYGYFSPDNEELLGKSFGYLISMRDLTQKKGIDFSVVIYPLLYKDFFGKYTFSPIHRKVMQFCNEQSIECLDAYVPFSGYYSFKEFMVHPGLDAHPNGEANRLVAQYLARHSKMLQKYRTQ